VGEEVDGMAWDGRSSVWSCAGCMEGMINDYTDLVLTCVLPWSPQHLLL
jgi:hypothetical protein